MKKACCFVIFVVVGCNPPSAPPREAGPKADPAILALAKSLVLDSEPAGAKGVVDVRKIAKDGDEIVVAGQVGGAVKPFVEGRASFVFVDPSFKPALECSCPWDFCDTDEDELKAGKATVKFVGGDGATLKAGARELFGLKELSEIVVKGKASRDDKGNLTILASGLFIRKGEK